MRNKINPIGNKLQVIVYRLSLTKACYIRMHAYNKEYM